VEWPDRPPPGRNPIFSLTLKPSANCCVVAVSIIPKEEGCCVCYNMSDTGGETVVDLVVVFVLY